MGKKQPKRRQHTVAKVYLEGFADERGRVQVKYRHGKHAFSSIKNASVRNYFYSFGELSNPNKEIEDWMGEKVETDATVPLRKLRTGLQPQLYDIEALAPFVAISLMRTETVRSHQEQVDSHLVPLLVLMDEAAQKNYNLLELSSQELQRHLDEVARSLAPYEVDKRSILRVMLRKSDEISTILSGWHWRLDTTEEPCLLTADAPVVALAPDAQLGWHGVLPQGSTAYLPISPRHLLTMSPTPLIGNGTVSDTLASRINAILCHNEVISASLVPVLMRYDINGNHLGRPEDKA